MSQIHFSIYLTALLSKKMHNFRHAYDNVMKINSACFHTKRRCSAAEVDYKKMCQRCKMLIECHHVN